MSDSSRRRAQSWPYERHEAYERRLRTTAADWFAGKGYAVQEKYPYILTAWERWPANIILPEVADYIARVRDACNAQDKPFPLHKYIHHGLSSQAMLFNLVGPLMVRCDLGPLEAAMRGAGLPWPGQAMAAFEFEERAVFNEDSGQPTSIDLVIQGAGGAPGLYLEAKLVEREFGGCSVFADGDCDGSNPAGDLSRCYLHHIGRLYWQRMAEQGCLDGPLAQSPICPLTSYYQFFREVLFALHLGGYFVLLYDARNPTFVRVGPEGERGLLPFLSALLPEALRDRVKRITIQEVYQCIRASGRHEDWAPEFAAKYGL